MTATRAFAPIQAQSRRELLRLTAAQALAMAIPLAHAQQPVSRSPTGWRIPGGHEPGTRIWLGFGGGHEALTLTLIRTLQSAQVPVGIWVANAQDQAVALESLRDAGIVPGTLRWAQTPGLFFFIRDATVLAQGPKGEVGAVNFRWSHYGTAGWCARRHAGDARAVASCTPKFDALREGLDAAMGRELRRQSSHAGGAARAGRTFDSNIALEGGALESNGEGTLIANEAFLRQRNPGRSRAQLENSLRRLPGVHHVIWVAEGLAEDPQMRASITAQYVGWGTGGHTDEFVRFADARTVLLAWPEDEDANQHPVARLTRQRMEKNLALLQASRNAKGERLKLIKIPMPRPVQREVVLRDDADTNWSDQWSTSEFPPGEGRKAGDVLLQVAVASYLNFVIAPGLVLLPDYLPHGTPLERQARVEKLFADAFPGKRIVFIDAIGLNWYGGGLHCATLNEP
jgi:agmatine deiminase